MKPSPLTIAAVIALALLMVIPAVSASGPPAFPHIFCGDVILNGAPAPDGTQVSATISSGTIITNFEAQNPVETVDGSYGKGDAYPLLVQGDIPDGAIITFYVNGASTGKTAVYKSGDGPTCVDLSIVTAATPQPTPEPTEEPTPVPQSGTATSGTGVSTPVTQTGVSTPAVTSAVPKTPEPTHVTSNGGEVTETPVNAPSGTSIPATPAQQASSLTVLPILGCIVVISAVYLSYRRQ